MDQHPNLKSRWILAAMGLLTLLGPAFGDGPEVMAADSLRLDVLWSSALDRNPRILAAHDMWRASREIAAQKGALPDPIPRYH